MKILVVPLDEFASWRMLCLENGVGVSADEIRAGMLHGSDCRPMFAWTGEPITTGSQPMSEPGPGNGWLDPRDMHRDSRRSGRRPRGAGGKRLHPPPAPSRRMSQRPTSPAPPPTPL